MNPSSVLVLVLVMPTPALYASVKYARPSSRTAIAHAGGVTTLSTIVPPGWVFCWQPFELDASAAVTGGNEPICSVGRSCEHPTAASATAVAPMTLSRFMRRPPIGCEFTQRQGADNVCRGE